MVEGGSCAFSSVAPCGCIVFILALWSRNARVERRWCAREWGKEGGGGLVSMSAWEIGSVGARAMEAVE